MAIENTIKPAIPTMSLGFAAVGHTLPDKLKAAAQAGFAGVEIFVPCLEAYAETFEGESQREKLCAAAKSTHEICDHLGLEVVCIQPVQNYDGIVDPEEHKERLEQVVFILKLAQILRTEIVQICASIRRDMGISKDKNKIVSDIREISDIAAQMGLKIAYEALSWSTYVHTWEDSWEIVKKVDRPNCGLCLDAFHIAGFEYADPTDATGVRSDGKQRLEKSLELLSSTVDPEKVFFIQIVDAEKINPPLGTPASPYYNKDQPALLSWSRNCRVFPYEEGGYLPVREILSAILKTGYKGWLSLELYDRFVAKESSPDLPNQYAQRGWNSWQKMKQDFSL